MLPPFQLEQAINQLVREEWGRILAALVKRVGNLQLAEDALQDAVLAALQHWQKDGLPDEPAAWLIQTARRKAIDQLRRAQRFSRLQPVLSYSLDVQQETIIEQLEADESTSIPDKRLEMIFTCCHPALEYKTRVALTLRTLGGLSTDEIARAFLDKPATMAQRLARARHKINAAGISYELPSEERIPERLGGVLSVVYFIFNEGYSPHSGQVLTRTALSDEAIRLGRILCALLPDNAEVSGLLALMLLHDSRRDARSDDKGNLVPLEDQQRSRWDQTKIEEGTRLLKVALQRQQLGPYQLQAAISALHAEANTWQKTDWPQIVALYELLYAMQPSPVVRINQIMAISYASSPLQALEHIHELSKESALQRYQPFLLAESDIRFRAGDRPGAIDKLQAAIRLTQNEKELQYLDKRLNQMQRVQ